MKLNILIITVPVIILAVAPNVSIYQVRRDGPPDVASFSKLCNGLFNKIKQLRHREDVQSKPYKFKATEQHNLNVSKNNETAIEVGHNDKSENPLHNKVTNVKTITIGNNIGVNNTSISNNQLQDNENINVNNIGVNNISISNDQLQNKENNEFFELYSYNLSEIINDNEKRQTFFDSIEKYSIILYSVSLILKMMFWYKNYEKKQKFKMKDF